MRIKDEFYELFMKSSWKFYETYEKYRCEGEKGKPTETEKA
jgi:hypothetical protein